MPKDQRISLKKYDGDPYIALAAAVVRRAVLDSQGHLLATDKCATDYLTRSAKMYLDNGAGGLPELLSVVPTGQASKRTQRENATPQRARSEGTTLISFRCPMDIHEWLLEVATQRGVSITSVIVAVLREQLAR